MDAVADRDFLVESVAALATCAVHLSRISEELVIWSSKEFGFVEMSDAFTTGSSMMPQKKNPDMAELVRGKSGRVVGDLVTLLVMLKGLPLTYNRDLQEDKPPVFDAFDTVDTSLEVLAGCIADARFDARRMRDALRDGHLEATDLADHLASKGLPFREAHAIVGKLVRTATERGTTLAGLGDELFQAHPALDAAALAVLDPEQAVERRRATGGPARAEVEKQLAALRARLRARGVAP
jgi:argininosuccinate lyase